MNSYLKLTILAICLSLSFAIRCEVENCASCVNDPICEKCKIGFVLYNQSSCVDAQTLNCASGQYQDQVGCTACPATYGMQSSCIFNLTCCHACNIDNCYLCEHDYLSCTKCMHNYILYDSDNLTCYDVSPFDCLTTVDYEGCGSCPTTQLGRQGLHYNFTDNLTACSPCTVDNCNNCANDYTTCDSCPTQWVMFNDSICLDCETIGCIDTCATDIGCTVCSPGYFPGVLPEINLQICLQCPPTCTSCLNNNWCVTCISGYELRYSEVNGTYCGPILGTGSSGETLTENFLENHPNTEFF